MAYALKEASPDLHVVAVSAANARVMYEILKAGEPVRMEEEETLAEALSGGIGVTNRFTLPLIRELADEHVLVSEEDIRAAMLFAAGSMNILLEGGGAVALAAVLARRWDASRRGVEGAAAVVLSGGNVALPRLQAIQETEPA